jgi:MarR family
MSIQPLKWTLHEKGWDVQLDEDGQLLRIVRAVQSLDFTTQSEVASAFMLHKATVSRALKKAVARGLITSELVNAHPRCGTAKPSPLSFPLWKSLSALVGDPPRPWSVL